MGKWGNIIEDMMAQMPEDLRTVALGVAEIFTNMDIETARKYIHPDFVDHEASEGVGGGPEGYLATAKYMNQAFSDASWKPQKIVASADGKHYTMDQVQRRSHRRVHGYSRHRQALRDSPPAPFPC